MKNKYFLLLCALQCIALNLIAAGGYKPAKAVPAPSYSGPGNMFGLNYGMYHNTYNHTSGGKTTDDGPSGYSRITPSFQAHLFNNWYGSLGFGYNTYKSTDYYNVGQFTNNTKVTESYYGPSVEFLRYCDDPCDDDDWYPFMGIDVNYFGGSRVEKFTDGMTHNTTTTTGKVNEFGAGIVGGAYYDLGKNFGLFGRVQLLYWDQFRTYPNKSDMNNYRTTSYLDVFYGGSLGVYMKLGGK